MKVYIVEAKRTAIGKFLGALSKESASEIASQVCQTVCSNINPNDIDELIVGNVLSAGTGQGLARQIALKSGFGINTTAYGIDMVCGSGMKSIMNGYSQIKSGQADIIVACGVESMSNAPFLLPAQVRGGSKLGNITSNDHILKDGLTDGVEGFHMGMTAENLAEKYELTRKNQDEFSKKSQEKALFAIENDSFVNEIIDYRLKDGSIFNVDEFPRETTVEKLTNLRPAFSSEGTVTAGNSSGINDGASAVLLMSRAALEKYNLKPLVEIIEVAQVGVDPRIMGIGPADAITKLLNKQKMGIEQVDLFELNEAFASQALSCIQELSSRYDIKQSKLENKTNVNGGAIALGHPLGMSGNRITVTLINEMIKRKSKYGVASLCIGGGMGTALLLKREEK